MKLTENHRQQKNEILVFSVTNAFAEEINADGYAPDAAQAVDLAARLLDS